MHKEMEKREAMNHWTTLRVGSQRLQLQERVQALSLENKELSVLVSDLRQQLNDVQEGYISGERRERERVCVYIYM